MIYGSTTPLIDTTFNYAYGYSIEKYGFDMLDIHMALSSLKCILLACKRGKRWVFEWILVQQGITRTCRVRQKVLDVMVVTETKQDKQLVQLK